MRGAGRQVPSFQCEAELLLLFFAKRRGDEAVGLPQMILEITVRQTGFGVVLDPRQAARRQVWRGSEPRPVFQDLKCG